VYREEYLDKDGSKREETNFSFPGARVFHRSEDKQILKLDFPTSATSSPYVGKFFTIQCCGSGSDISNRPPDISVQQLLMKLDV
jgi:hypothetical protein